jgi:hypothetical protein
MLSWMEEGDYSLSSPADDISGCSEYSVVIMMIMETCRIAIYDPLLCRMRAG